MDRKGGSYMTEKELLAARQSIVQKLTQARLEKGLSQEQLATVSYTHLSKLLQTARSSAVSSIRPLKN